MQKWNGKLNFFLALGESTIWRWYLEIIESFLTMISEGCPDSRKVRSEIHPAELKYSSPTYQSHAYPQYYQTKYFHWFERQPGNPWVDTELAFHEHRMSVKQNSKNMTRELIENEKIFNLFFLKNGHFNRNPAELSEKWERSEWESYESSSKMRKSSTSFPPENGHFNGNPAELSEKWERSEWESYESSSKMTHFPGRRGWRFFHFR
jgi:hypothetical protein